MALFCEIRRIPDPDARGSALRLKGDWIFVYITDGRHEGAGEATHSGDDMACAKTIRTLFDRHLANLDPSLETIQKLEEGAFSTSANFIEATAISALNQALYELVAYRKNVPVWKLFVEKPVQEKICAYTTINRCLRARDFEDYRAVVQETRNRGFRHFKCAPFEKVDSQGNQASQAQEGLEILRFLRGQFPDSSIRIDFHQRFTPEAFFSILPELQPITPFWIEEPFLMTSHYPTLRKKFPGKIALGELHFGSEKFKEISENQWAHILMPDVKHVGGFGPLLKVCNLASQYQMEISPHNPSGPISTLASIHAGAVSPNVTSIEYPFDKGHHRHSFQEPLDNGVFTVPNSPGWGLTLSKDRMENLSQASHEKA